MNIAKDLLEQFQLERKTYMRLIENYVQMDQVNFPDPFGSAIKDNLRITRQALANLERAISIAEGRDKE